MEEEALVEHVRKFEVIYNPALTAYHNKDKREAAWKIVSEVLANQVFIIVSIYMVKQ